MRLLVVGDGPERSQIEGDLAARGLREAVEFTGSVDPSEIPGLLASMDAAVAPYSNLRDFYFSPLKVYEYMAAGRAVVASRIGQLDGLIEHGVSGLLCTPGDSRELAECPAAVASRTGPARPARVGPPATACAGSTPGTRARGESSNWRGWPRRTRIPSARSRSMKPPQTLHESLPGLRHIFWFFWPRLRRQNRLVVGSFLAMFAEVVLGTLEPWPLKFIFDQVLGTRRHGHSNLLSAFESLDTPTVIAVSAVAIILLAGLRAVADYASTIGFTRVANRVLTELRADVYRHLQGLSLSFHNRSRSGDLLLRLTSDISKLRDMAVTAALPLVADTLVLCGIIGVMVWMNWRLASSSLAMLPVFGFWTLRLTGRIHRAARSQRQKESAIAATAAETIGAIKVIQALCLEGRFAASFMARNRETDGEDVRMARLTASLGRSVAILIAVSTALVLWFGARLVLRQELTPGELLVFMTYLRNAFRPVRDLAKYTGRIVKATAAGERVIHLLEQTPEVRDLPGACAAPPFRGALRFEGVDFAYEPARRILNQVDFQVEPGQRVAVVGPSGIGKSTLASLILRLYDPTDGRVSIDGHDIRDYTLASLREQIGVVLQDSLLFAATIGENIAWGTAAPHARRSRPRPGSPTPINS